MTGRRVLFSAQKNEGPFILEWVAFHKVVGFTDIVIVSNDCTDGSDALLDDLAAAGQLTHIRQTVPEGVAPQLAAEQLARTRGVFRPGDWVMWLDLDEYLNVQIGSGTVQDLIAQTPDADAISVAWRYFGDAGREWAGRQVTSAYTLASRRRFPLNQTVKSLTRMSDRIARLELHRPAFADGVQQDDVSFVHSGGGPVPDIFFRAPFRGGTHVSRLVGVTKKHRLAQVNHYAVRSPRAFDRRRARGNGAIAATGQSPKDDVRETTAFYARANRNDVDDRSILRHAFATYRTQEDIERLISRQRNAPPVTVEWDNAASGLCESIGSFLITAITGRQVERPAHGDLPAMLGPGTDLAMPASGPRVIWGSGAAHGVPRRMRRSWGDYPLPDLRAVRGKLTADLLSRAFGLDRPVALGDPRLLISRHFRHEGEGGPAKVIIVPQLLHQNEIVDRLASDHGVRILDERSEDLSILAQVSNASACISTSLHGLVLAQAFDVPWCWLKIGERQLPDDDFAFLDFFSTLTDPPATYELDTLDALDAGAFASCARMARLPRLGISLDALEDSFPFDMVASRFDFPL